MHIFSVYSSWSFLCTVLYYRGLLPLAFPSVFSAQTCVWIVVTVGCLLSTVVTWVVPSLTTAVKFAEYHESKFNLFYFHLFIFKLYFIPYVTVLPESPYHGKEVLFKFPSAHSVWRATSQFNKYLEGGVSSEFTSGIFCFEVSHINNAFLIKNCINQYTSHRTL